jgi:hypothetical protein
MQTSVNTESHIITTTTEPVLAIDVAGIRPVVKTGYEWLEDMIHVRNNRGSYKPNNSPVTNRVMFIINALNEIGVPYELDIFDDAGYDLYNYDRPKLVNVVVKFGSRSGQPAIVFSAHHDIANPNSQNCQDNSASVCNLLHLASKLKQQAFGENNNTLASRPVIIVFTDKEECGGVGARRMSGRLLRGDFGQFEYNINLELTGLGRSMWIDSENFRHETKTPSILKMDEVLGETGYHNVSTPFSDSVIFRRCGIDSLCIGILPAEELATGRHDTWHLCHSETDTIDKCNADDMSNFTDILERFVIGNLN